MDVYRIMITRFSLISFWFFLVFYSELRWTKKCIMIFTVEYHGDIEHSNHRRDHRILTRCIIINSFYNLL